jgi:hypothetical protein
LEPPGGAKPGAELLVTAVIVNLLNLRLEICTLLLIHDPSWHCRHVHGDGVRPFCFNKECSHTPLEKSFIAGPDHGGTGIRSFVTVEGILTDQSCGDRKPFFPSPQFDDVLFSLV